MISDVRYAVRALLIHPAFALAATLTLALGIGANTAIFAVLYGVLLKPLPYASPDRLMVVGETRRGLPWNVAYPNYLDWQTRNHVFSQLAIFNAIGSVVVGGHGAGEIYPMATGEVTLLPLMGIAPQFGRLFAPDERDPHAASVAVISDAMWRSQFGGDPGVTGKTTRMNDDDVTVIGVLPPGVRPFNVDVWFPFRPALLSPSQLDRDNHPGFRVVGRLKDGVDVEQAQREMSAIAASLAIEYPASNREMGVLVRPMLEAVAGGIRPTLRMLGGGVCVLLLIACANVANLLLAKGLRRERETSIRSALGADRGRLIRLFVAEGVTLGVAGAAGGVLLAGWCVRLLRNVPGLNLPRSADVTIDPHVLGFAAALAIGTAALFALAPALQLSRVDVMRVLRPAGGGEPASPRGRRLRGAILAAEVALLAVLLAGASLMQRTLQQLASVDLGIDANRLLVVPMQSPHRRSGETSLVFADRLLAAVTARGGVEAAAVSWPFDYTGGSWAPNIDIDEHPFEPGHRPPVATAAVSDGYFRTMGIPIVRGRGFDADERPGGRMTLVVNQTFAKRFFAGEGALGKHVSPVGYDAPMQHITIVGIVGDTRRGGALKEPVPEMYVSYKQFAVDAPTLIVRTSGTNPLALGAEVRAAVAATDPAVASGALQRLDNALARTYGDRRALSWLLSTFASVALGLTIISIASVVSFTVAQRRSEIGVRVALGASTGDIIRMILRDAMTPVVAGLAAGALALMPATRALRASLYGVSPADPGALGVAVGLIALSALAAAYVPARRAAAIDPLVAIRTE
jgi:putative ABC transport system permease protein